MILVVDNYDSFTYNLVQYLEELGAKTRVLRNDRAELLDLDLTKLEAIVISPGPGTPRQAGHSVEVIKRYHQRLPILGVCLGHQAIAYAFGAKIVRARRIMHGKVSPVSHDGKGVYKGLPEPFEATRYHSLVVEKRSLPRELKVVSKTSLDEIMGIRHVKYPLEGVQFHPESILSAAGKPLLGNFLRSCGVSK
jgi:anthranilate synthase/aminodeoxychorismate synthase-like glutamine amidotransferase